LIDIVKVIRRFGWDSEIIGLRMDLKVRIKYFEMRIIGCHSEIDEWGFGWDSEIVELRIWLGQ